MNKMGRKELMKVSLLGTERY